MRPALLGYFVNGTLMIGGHSQTTCPGPERMRFVRSRSVVCRQIAGETLVVPIRGKVGDLASIYKFNCTGSFLWSALEQPRSLEDLSFLLQQSFEVTRDEAQRDTSAFVHEMQAAGLLAQEG